jgi:queuosine precursor transporter
MTLLDQNSNDLQGKKRRMAIRLYLILTALFVAALVTCNLIANKFITIDLGFKEFVISAGVLPYPLTFLITDILSELYGRKKTNLVVLSGFVASILVLVILQLGKIFPAIGESPVSDGIYNQVFANSWRVISASMVAYIFAQLVDVRLFHFWKDLTAGKHLWLRNNASTILSQLLDTTLVVFVLFIGVLPINKLLGFILDGWFFKVICALIDTPILYAVVFISRSVFNLQPHEEITID